VHARRAGLDHRLHQLECVQHAPNPDSASATIGANQSSSSALGVVQLVGACERVVDPAHRAGTLDTEYSDWSGYI